LFKAILFFSLLSCFGDFFTSLSFSFLTTIRPFFSACTGVHFVFVVDVFVSHLPRFRMTMESFLNSALLCFLLIAVFLAEPAEAAAGTAVAIVLGKKPHPFFVQLLVSFFLFSRFCFAGLFILFVIVFAIFGHVSRR
jgi:hypothetical protein